MQINNDMILPGMHQVEVKAMNRKVMCVSENFAIMFLFFKSLS